MLQAQLRIEHLVTGAQCLLLPGAVFDIEPLPFPIGRGKDCHLIVSHHEISRRQAQIGADGD
ncbi:MAG: FHA domain-containing protein, partial [Anaerolineales bacterium]|nr:FHA domain-containing protein [Anaerolineales bacterium]